METISACENVCRDFSWVGPLTEWASNLAVFVGIIIAWRQLEAWRQEQSSRRKAEVAEELVFLAKHVEDAFQHIRNPLDRVPADEARKPESFYQRRYERVHSFSELFKQLRAYQVRSMTLIGDDEVEQAINALFSARNKILIAIELLHDLKFESGEMTVEDRQMQVDLRRDMTGSFSSNDKLGREIASAVETISKRLTPVARLARHGAER